ncbi:MAG: hypothetical protein KKF78_06650 [Candidatus Omnitrophica bacterium]|nr:hypothetical protein [Candidatus Omnitrophota bacterium]MBU1996817.1 hypothetical protein [Candidatus Omnitrophota bacterium]
MTIKDQEDTNKTSKLVIFAFTLSILYWIYLFLISQMLIIQDALGYKELGELIANKGWLEYFSAGPRREPFYPFLVSISLRFADTTPFSFETLQKFQQLLFLFATQILSYKLLKNLKVRPFFISLAILYIGFSPALINTYLCLFSEIAILPFMIATILLSSKVWKNIASYIEDTSSSTKKIILNSLMLGFLFLILTLTKGIFEITLFVLFIPFMIFAIKGIQKKKKRLCLSNILVILCLLATFFIPLNLYKYANKKYNGTFALTNRASFALFGNLRRRSEKITSKSLASAYAFVVGEAFCMKTIDPDSCRFWSYFASDHFAGQQRLKYLDLTTTETNKRFTALAKKELIKTPFNQILFASIETLKMFFFETPNNIGFVVYPRWLDKLYHTPKLIYSFTFLMAFMSFFSFIFSICYVWTKRKQLNFTSCNNNNTFTILSILLLMGPFIGLHSLFFVLPRYANPIIPLHVILISFCLNNILPRTKKD